MSKRLKPGSRDPLPEDNWVWSAQGAVDMHMPERWGYVQFADRAPGSQPDPFAEDPNERVKWALRRLYYRQSDYRRAHGTYATSLDALDAGNIPVDGLSFRPMLQTTASQYEIAAPGFGGATIHLNHEGRVWSTR